MFDPDVHDGFVDLDEAAARMNLTKRQVMELVRLRALRSLDLGVDVVLVEPAIVNMAP